jgi:hypothetical protein
MIPLVFFLPTAALSLEAPLPLHTVDLSLSQHRRNFNPLDGLGPADVDNIINAARDEGLQWLKYTNTKLNNMEQETENDFTVCFGTLENKASVTGKRTILILIP